MRPGVAEQAAGARDGSPAVQLTVIILTFNEELHIERCLTRIAPLASRMVVVDSGSTDRTVEIARAQGAEVLTHSFVNHAAQFQWGLDQAAVTDGWVMKLDADEYLEGPLIAELRDLLPRLEPEVTAIDLKRKVFFRGQWIRWGGYANAVFTRIWRAGVGHMEQRWMDEHMVIAHGRHHRPRGWMVDDNLNPIGWWIAKHNGYTSKQMVDFMALELGGADSAQRSGAELNAHARVKRWLRNRLFARSPLYLRSTLYFMQRYFLRLGFLDGRQGFLFHFMQGWWNFMLVDAKVDEARAVVAREGVAGYRAWVERVHGIDLKAFPDAG